MLGSDTDRHPKSRGDDAKGSKAGAYCGATGIAMRFRQGGDLGFNHPQYSVALLQQVFEVCDPARAYAPSELHTPSLDHMSCHISGSYAVFVKSTMPAFVRQAWIGEVGEYKLANLTKAECLKGPTFLMSFDSVGRKVGHHDTGCTAVP